MSQNSPLSSAVIRLQHVLLFPSPDVLAMCLSSKRKNLSIDSINHSKFKGTCTMEVSHWVDPHLVDFEVLKIAAGFGSMHQGFTTLSREAYGDAAVLERSQHDEQDIEAMTLAIFAARSSGGILHENDRPRYTEAAIAALTVLGIL